ncbi:MAG: hypothetical protein JST92_25700 [Deltaproteobacteria bacterium]|nr:hypothetical protein [Deltaproteobacteria bacterium]
MSERKPDQIDDDESATEGEKPAGILPDLVKRAVLTGMGALFMTEEGIRKIAGDVKLPKDVLAFLVTQADRTRTEVARVVTAEVRRFLESETLRREVWKLLTSVTLEVNATVQLKPSGEPGFTATLKKKDAPPAAGANEPKPEGVQ